MKREMISRTTKGLRHRGLFMVLMSAGIAAGAVSCSNSDEKDTAPKDRTEVVFKIDNEQTRAVITNSVRRIGVFGYSHAGDYAAAMPAAAPDYFLNQRVIDAANNGIWTYSGVVKYWPTDGRNVSFFAYAPYEDLDEQFVLYPNAATDIGNPTITYTVPASVYDQLDLLYGRSVNQTSQTNGGVVAFEMDHALTRIGFQVKLNSNEVSRPYTVTINELSLQNVVGTGTLDLSKAMNGAGMWTLYRPTDASDLSTYTLTPAANGGLNTIVLDATTSDPAPAGSVDPWNYNDMLVDGQYLMLLPQPLELQPDALPQQELILKYTVTNTLLGITEDVERDILLHNTSLPDWKAGVGINYQIIISVIDDIVIEFEIYELTPWGDGNGNYLVNGEIN